MIDYSFVLKLKTKLLIPAQTGNRTVKMYTSIETIYSVDHWPLKSNDMQLKIALDYFNCFN